MAHGQRVLSLDDCLDLARARNLQLSNSHIALAAGTVSRKELAASQLPQVSAALAANYAPHSDRWGYDPSVTNGGQIGALVSIKHTLYFSSVSNLRRRAAQLDQGQLELQVHRTNRELTRSVEETFTELLRSRDEVELRLQSVARLSDYLDKVKLHFQGGLSGYGDILKTRTKLLTAQETESQATEAYALAKLVMADLIGSRTDTSFRPGGSLDSSVARIRQTAFIPDTLDNPDLLAARNDRERAGIELALSEAERVPAVSVSLDGGYQASLDLYAAHDGRIPLGLSTGATMEIPLVDWGVLKYRLQRQKLIIDTMETVVKIQAKAILARHRRATLQLLEAFSLLESVQARVRDALDDYLLTMPKYVAGASTAADLLLSQQTYTDALADELLIKSTIIDLAIPLELHSAQ